MANFFTSKGECMMPYGVDVLERTVSASRGRMKPGCKFKCTMYSQETPGLWSLPIIFRARYVSLDEGIRINYRVTPGLIVWLLLLLPVAAIATLLVLDIAVEFVGLVGGLIGVVYFAYTFQRGKAIARFEQRFGK